MKSRVNTPSRGRSLCSLLTKIHLQNQDCIILVRLLYNSLKVENVKIDTFSRSRAEISAHTYMVVERN